MHSGILPPRKQVEDLVQSIQLTHDREAAMRNALLAFIIALTVSACGGGGGSDAAPPNAGGSVPDTSTPPAANTVSGTLQVIAEDSPLLKPLASSVVKISRLGPDGTINPEVLGSANTDASGQFTITLPTGTKPSRDLVLHTTDPTGQTWRALAVLPKVQLGPHSEAFVQELFAAKSRFGGDLNLSDERLARLQNTVSLMLLLNGRSTNNQINIDDMRWWIKADPAAKAALDALSTSGKLPDTFGDLGGFAGYTESAMELTGSASENITTYTLRDDDPSKANAWKTSSYGAARAEIGYTLVDDGVTQTSYWSKDFFTQQLFYSTGKLQTFSLNYESNSPIEVVNINQSSNTFDFDGDGKGDPVEFSIKQSTAGIETIEIFGERRPSLAIDVTTSIKVRTSAGGSIVFKESRRQWSIPFLGVAKFQSTVNTTDNKGNSSTVNTGFTVTRAVANKVSWPGKIHIESYALPQSNNSRIIAKPSESSVVVLDNDPIIGTNRLNYVDLTGKTPIVQVKGIPVSYTQLRASNDGKTTFLLTKSPGCDYYLESLSLDEANVKSPTLTAYDSRTLVEKFVTKLPPYPSKTKPGLYTPRCGDIQLIPSPYNSDDVLVTGTYDHILISKGVAIQDSVITNDDPNRPTTPFIYWDPVSKQAMRSTHSRGLPISLEFHTSTDTSISSQPVLRSDLMFSPLGAKKPSSYAAYADHLDGSLLYSHGFRLAIDYKAAAVIGDITETENSCGPTRDGIICLSENSIAFRNKDLTLRKSVSLQTDLRGITKQLLSFNPMHQGQIPRIEGQTILTSGRVYDPITDRWYEPKLFSIKY